MSNKKFSTNPDFRISSLVPPAPDFPRLIVFIFRFSRSFRHAENQRRTDVPVHSVQKAVAEEELAATLFHKTRVGTRRKLLQAQTAQEKLQTAKRRKRAPVTGL